MCQYKFVITDDVLIGELISETIDTYIIKSNDNNVNTIYKKDIIDCTVVMPRTKGTWETIEETIQGMLNHGM